MPSYSALESVDQVANLADMLISDGGPFAFDIETGYEGSPKEGASLHPEEGFVVGISLTNDVGWARYIPLAHDFGANLPAWEVAPHLWRLLQSGMGVAHNIKFELRHLAKFFRTYLSDHPVYGAAVVASRGYFPFRSDTMIETYLLAQWTSNALKSLSEDVFNHNQATLNSLFPKVLTKKEEKQVRFNELGLSPNTIAYACEDSVWCLALHLKHYDIVLAEYGFMFRVEKAIVPILCEMEDYGLRYDWPAMATRADDVRGFRADLRAEIMTDLTASIGRPMDVNLGSPKQLSDVLFGDLGLRTSIMTNGSKDSDDPKMSTNAVALEALSKKMPVVRKILDWKEVNKLLGSYLEKYERDYSYAADGRTHPSHLQAHVGSGRFAVSDPPYQQTPKKYHYELSSGRILDFNFREFIIPDPGNYLIGFDYSQVELRVMAGASQEPALLMAFAKGEDVHARTAALMFHVAIEDVTDDLRDKGKTLNFALLYLMGIKGLADRLAITQEAAAKLFDQYFAAYSAIRTWVDRTQEFARNNGYTLSHFGRKCMIWELRSDKRWIYAKGERLAVNAPIQGGAADYMKIAMVRVYKVLRDTGLWDRGVRIIMNIHDALYFEAPKDVKPNEIIEALQGAITFDVASWPKIEAEWSLGYKWGTMRKLDVTPEGKVVGFKKGKEKPPEPDAQAVDKPVDPQVLAGASVAAEPTREGSIVAQTMLAQMDARELRVKLTAMPDSAQYERFLSEVGKRPGVNTIVLETPEGDAELSTKTSLTVDDGPLVSMCLGGALVKWAPSSVDGDVVVEGLEL